MAEAIPYIVAPDDPGLTSAMVEYPGGAGNIKGYLSRPKDGGKLGSVIVIHENKGLVEHIKDVARRLAKEGFAALAVDLLSRQGGTEQYKTEQDAIAAIKNVTQDIAVEDLRGTVAYLNKQDFFNGRIGVVGFCWGGGQSLNFATKCKELNAAIVFYGRNPSPLDQVQNIPCPLLGNYGGDDPNIMPGVEPLKEALTKFGKIFDIKVYPGAKHAFNNNTNADRYNPEAAKGAWERTVSFYKKNLAA
ncbi:MAG: dienelactone hydrolase family protein [Candidatus Binatia bacterium]